MLGHWASCSRARASAEKFPGWGQRKKDRKLALLSLFRGWGTTKKKTKNSKKSDK